MSADFAGKTVLVTGSTRGIGLAIAQLFSARGARVVVHGSGPTSNVEIVCEGLVAAGGDAIGVRFDTANTSAIESALSPIGKIDILISNAGIAKDGLALRLRDEDFDRVMAVNVRGAMAVARALLPAMVRAKGGRMVFLSSVVGETGNAGQVAYATSKAAVLGLTKSLAREYASRGITVNAVAPGLIDTDMTRNMTEAMKSTALASVPLARMGTPGDVAEACAFLASDGASYITGQVLRVNGGLYI